MTGIPDLRHHYSVVMPVMSVTLNREIDARLAIELFHPLEEHP
ncbi:hypothetical protein [Caballeronia sp. HLA56]